MGLIFDHPRHVARHFGRNIRTIQRWMRAGMPQLSGGLFDADEIEAWLQQHRPWPELQAKPPELEYLPQPVTSEIEALCGAGCEGLRQGFKTLRKALLLGGYQNRQAREIILQINAHILLDELDA